VDEHLPAPVHEADGDVTVFQSGDDITITVDDASLILAGGLASITGATASLTLSPTGLTGTFSGDVVLSERQGLARSDAELLENAGRLRDIPGIIVQGRYDVVCPMRSAWDLHRAWPEAALRVVPDAGHSAFEPGITHELILATDRFARSSNGSHGHAGRSLIS
jgi:proline iminopeptidase